ncbi:MAG: hypothetical protein IJN94_02385 [Clostridia bacterium]|nr:hypothetical protein [Clostridia bacterium]
MKIKKILAVILTVALLSGLATTNVSASEGLSYSATDSKVITTDYTLDPDSFQISLSVDDNKICSLDGTSKNYTAEITSFSAIYTEISGTTHSCDYIVSPEDFFEVFEKRDADIEYAETYNADKEPEYHLKVSDITLVSSISISFDENSVFGALEYNISINGFSAPALSTGSLGFGDTALLFVPTELNLEGVFYDFPVIASQPTILSKPTKTNYTDAEKYDATGLKIEITTSAGATGTFSYNDSTSHLFKFNPSNKENLTIDNSEAIIYLSGVEILKTPINVEHQWSADYVNITTYKYTPNKPGYHAIVCEGCGETHDATPHEIDENSWTYNNDQTFVSNGTESTNCLICNAVITRDTVGTADFNTAFADMHFIKVIFEYINILLQLIGATL